MLRALPPRTAAATTARTRRRHPMTEKRARIPLPNVRTPSFERDYPPAATSRARTRFRTIDDVVFEVYDASVVSSAVMTKCIHMARFAARSSATPSSLDSDPPHTLPNVSSEVLETVLRYCYFHASQRCADMSSSDVKRWDDDFAALDPDQLCDLASAAYYLDIKDLVDLTCRAIAALISGKSAEQIRKTFHIENDLDNTIDRVLPRVLPRDFYLRGNGTTSKDTISRLLCMDRLARKDVRTRARSAPTAANNERHDSDESAGVPPMANRSVEELTEWINSGEGSKTPGKRRKNKKKNKSAAKRSDSDVAQRAINSTPADLAPSNGTSEHFVPSVSVETGAAPIATSSAKGEGVTQDKDVCNGNGLDSHMAVITEEVLAEGSDGHLKVDNLAPTTRLEPCSQTMAIPSEPRTAEVATIHQVKSCTPIEVMEVVSSPDRRAKSRESSSHNLHGALKSTIPRPQESICLSNEALRDSCGDEASRQRDDENGASSRPTADDIDVIEILEDDDPSPSYINCPDTMDREVEAFEKRLSIDDSAPAAPPSEMFIGSNVRTRASAQNSVRSAVKEEVDDEVTFVGDVVRVAKVEPGTDDKLRREELELEERMVKIKERVLEIDQQVADLHTERERVRDTLALVNMQLSTLRKRGREMKSEP